MKLTDEEKDFREEFVSLYKAAESMVGLGGNAKYTWEKLWYYRNELFKLSPLQIDDRVCINDTFVLSEEKMPGWWHCRHFLKPGAQGVVCEVSHDNGKFYCSVEFDHETWIDDRGEVFPTNDKHTFCFEVCYLEKL